MTLKFYGMPFLCLSLSLNSYIGSAQDKPQAFIPAAEAINTRALLPAPPDIMSLEFLVDRTFYEEGKRLRTSERGTIAANDAKLDDAHIGTQFSQALGVTLSPTIMPETFLLFKRLLRDTVNGVREPKAYYQRIRPFALYGELSCTPHDEAHLKDNGAYPSGHTMFGWMVALVLSELFPDKADALLQKGYEYGESRMICGVHWKSDVDAGRTIAAATVAKLHSNQDFLTQLAKVKTELMPFMQ